MKLYRFMSLVEFNKLLAGMKLVNNNKFFSRNTNSEGFCFLSEKIKICDDVYFLPQECYRFLRGIVSDCFLVEFETELQLDETVGCYANPFTNDYYDYIVIKEFCIKSYDREKIVPLRYGYVDFSYNVKWYNVN